MDITTKHTKSTKEENIFLLDSMSSPLSGLRVLRDLRGEKAFFEWRIRDNRPPGKFSQAAKTLKYSSA
jgi:hypothetical protein